MARKRGLTLGREQVGRYLAAAFGVVALICFYQPWVAATLPGIGESVLTGVEIARGDAAERVDAASAPAGGAAPGALPRPGGTVGVGATGSGGLVLPTRIATAPAGSGAASAGGLVLPTRIATAVPGSQGAGVAVATSAAATASAFQTARAGGGLVAVDTGAETAPDRLPGLMLYAVPLAALGLAVFAAVWGRLHEPRDRRYGMLWSLILSVGGTLWLASLLYKVTTAAADVENNLLAPGDVTATLWGFWGTFAGFLLAASSLVVAWIRAPATRR